MPHQGCTSALIRMRANHLTQKDYHHFTKKKSHYCMRIIWARIVCLIFVFVVEQFILILYSESQIQHCNAKSKQLRYSKNWHSTFLCHILSLQGLNLNKIQVFIQINRVELPNLNNGAIQQSYMHTTYLCQIWSWAAIARPQGAAWIKDFTG